MGSPVTLSVKATSAYAGVAVMLASNNPRPLDAARDTRICRNLVVVLYHICGSGGQHDRYAAQQQRVEEVAPRDFAKHES